MIDRRVVGTINFKMTRNRHAAGHRSNPRALGYIALAIALGGPVPIAGCDSASPDDTDTSADDAGETTESDASSSSESSEANDGGDAQELECSIASRPACDGGRLDCEAEAHVPCGYIEAAYDRFGCQRLDCQTHFDCPEGSSCLRSGWTFVYDCRPGSEAEVCECSPPESGQPSNHCVDHIEWPDAPLHRELEQLSACSLPEPCPIVTVDEGEEVLSEFAGYTPSHRCVLEALRNNQPALVTVRSQHDESEWANAYREHRFLLGDNAQAATLVELRWEHGPVLPEILQLEPVRMAPMEYFDNCLRAVDIEVQRACLDPASWWQGPADQNTLCPTWRAPL